MGRSPPSTPSSSSAIAMKRRWYDDALRVSNTSLRARSTTVREIEDALRPHLRLGATACNRTERADAGHVDVDHDFCSGAAAHARHEMRVIADGRGARRRLRRVRALAQRER